MEDVYSLSHEEIKVWAKWVKKLSDKWGKFQEEKAGGRAKEQMEKIETGSQEEKKEVVGYMQREILTLDEEIAGLKKQIEERETRITELSEEVKSGKDARGRPLTDDKINEKQASLASLGDDKKVIEGERNKRVNKRENIKNALSIASGISGITIDGISPASKEDAEERKGELESALIKLQIKAIVQEQMKALKDHRSAEFAKTLKKDKNGNYTAESIKAAYEAMEEDEKFLATACVDLAMRVEGGYAGGLFEVQIVAGLLSAEGYVVNVKTGEGKTEFANVAQTISSITGMKTFAETSNENLARKDFLARKPVLDFLGVRSALFSAGDLRESKDRDAEVRRLFDENAMEADGVDVVVFDTPGFNFELATNIAKEKEDQKTIKTGRKFMFIITDEIDAAMREASTQYRIALKAEPLSKKDYERVKMAVIFADQIVNKSNKGRYVRSRLETGEEVVKSQDGESFYYSVDLATGRITYSEDGEKAIQDEAKRIAGVLGADQSIVLKELKTSIEMLETYGERSQYSVMNGEIKLYDASGLLGNRRLSDGKHTILEMYQREVKGDERVVVHGDSSSTSEIGGGPARTEYFVMQSGSSGTALASGRELGDILQYRVPKSQRKGIIDIPTHIDRVIESSSRYVVDGASEKVDMLRAWVRKGVKKIYVGRDFEGKDKYEYVFPASLIYVRTTAQAEMMQEIINGVMFEMADVNGEDVPHIQVNIVHGDLRGDSLKKAVDNAGNRNTLTIFTDAGARGTNYQAAIRNISTMKRDDIDKQFAPLLSVLTSMDAVTAENKVEEFRRLLLEIDADDNRKTDPTISEVAARIKDLLRMEGRQAGAKTLNEARKSLVKALQALKSRMNDDQASELDQIMTLAEKSDEGITEEDQALLKSFLENIGRIELAVFGKGREAALWRLKSFFEGVEKELLKKIESETDPEKARGSNERMKEFQSFRIDVETRYVKGFRLLAQLSDKSIGDLLQALGRVGRQSDPAEISLFFDIDEGSEDAKITEQGFKEDGFLDTLRGGKKASYLKTLREYRDTVRKYRELAAKAERNEGETLQMDEFRRKTEELKESIYEQAFDALWDHDKSGQDQRVDNHHKDLIVYRTYAYDVAPYRGKVLEGKVSGLTKTEMASNWLDDLASEFKAAAASKDDEKMGKLRLIYVSIFGENSFLMDSLRIKLKNGTVITLRDPSKGKDQKSTALNGDNVTIFTAVMKALVEGRDHETLAQEIKDVISAEDFNELAKDFSKEKLLTGRFEKLFNQAIAELLQYEYFDFVGKQRGLERGAFDAAVKKWFSDRKTELPSLMPGRMTRVCVNAINSYFYDKPLSLEKRIEQQKKENEKWSASIKNALKKAKGAVSGYLEKAGGVSEKPAGRVTIGAGAGMAAGAAAGSLFAPIIGTAIGAAVGAVVGAVAGFFAGGRSWYDWDKMKQGYGGRGAVLRALGTTAKEAARGMSWGVLTGALLAGALLAVGAGVIAPWLIVGGAVLGAVVKGSLGVWRVFRPQVVRSSEEKSGEGLEERRVAERRA
ncbi:MAG: hypothetical protein PHT95_04490, partial [Candidatus Omnitrophica bacterium]|nr:hypothetical protein [Candidatus Omnitrophota bacterium]